MSCRSQHVVGPCVVCFNELWVHETHTKYTNNPLGPTTHWYTHQSVAGPCVVGLNVLWFLVLCVSMTDQFRAWVDSLMIVLPPSIALLWMVISMFRFQRYSMNSEYHLGKSMKIEYIWSIYQLKTWLLPGAKYLRFMKVVCPAIRANKATKIKGRIILLTIIFMLFNAE